MSGVRPAPLQARRVEVVPGAALSSPVPEGRDDRASERVIVIEFRWRGPNGVQPVIYLDRLLLH